MHNEVSQEIKFISEKMIREKLLISKFKRKENQKKNKNYPG